MAKGRLDLWDLKVVNRKYPQNKVSEANTGEHLPIQSFLLSYVSCWHFPLLAPNTRQKKSIPYTEGHRWSVYRAQSRGQDRKENAE